MAFELDLNTRERTRYAEMLETLSTEAGKAAEALRNVDDQEFLVSFIILSLTGPSITKELRPILTEASEAAKLNQEMKGL